VYVCTLLEDSHDWEGGVYISTLSGILVKHEVVNIENMYVFEL